MSQDQYSQARGPGYVERGDAVPDDETEGYPTEESKPMTRFQKVASALRGERTDRDEADQEYQDQDPDTPGANPPWVTDQDEAVAVTNPDVPVTPADPDADAADHAATEPDIFGTNSRAGNGATSAPYPEGQTDQASAAIIADVPAAGTPAGEATGTAGRHAAAGPTATESRPGEAAGTLGDFSDLTYGNLIADGAVYIEQWQQVQFKFVDDPHASVTEAAEIIAQVTARLEAAIQERQRAIEERQRAIAEQQRSLRGRWGEGSNADTEGLRETLRMYRTFLDQLIGPRAG
jgi:hypothetical protein